MKRQIREDAGRLVLNLGTDRLNPDMRATALVLKATRHATGFTSNASFLVYDESILLSHNDNAPCLGVEIVKYSPP
jgi:hypothetical protein